jgi:hypothetical protein
MNGAVRTVGIAIVCGLAVASMQGRAETPGEIPKPWTYEGSKKLQEQAPQPQVQQPHSQGGGAMRSGGGAAPGAAEAEAARRAWLARPALPAERNPLLGARWTRPASTRADPNDPFGQLKSLAKGGLCEVLFGGGTFEFRPDRLVGMDAHTPEQELDRVEYRGDARHVVVLPKTTVKLMEWDVETPDRIRWAAANCVLVRAGSAPAVATAPPSKQGGNAATTGGGGKIAFYVGEPSAQNKVAGRPLWVLREDAQVALAKGGIAHAPNATVLQTWMRSCAPPGPVCQKGSLALKPYSVGLVTADATGHAQTPALPAGRYWVLSDAHIANRHVMWNQPVDVRGGDRSLTLDQRNAMPVD